jgi:hypothetical protein
MKALEITIVCENIAKGERVVAVTYDAEIQRRFSAGSHDAKGAVWWRVWEAIAWLFDEYIAFSVYGAGPSMCRNGSDRPGDRFARLAKPGIVYQAPSETAQTSDPGSKPSAATRRSTAKKRTKKNAG